MLAVFPLLFFNSSMVESSKPVLIALTSSAKLALKPDTKMIDEISNNENMQLYPRIYLNMGINSNVEIYETQISNDNKQYYINSVIEVVMHENSNLNWTLLQNLNCNIGHLSSFDLGLEKNAELKYNFYDFGGGFIRRDINVNFYEPGASLDLNGLFNC